MSGLEGLAALLCDQDGHDLPDPAGIGAEVAGDAPPGLAGELAGVAFGEAFGQHACRLPDKAAQHFPGDVLLQSDQAQDALARHLRVDPPGQPGGGRARARAVDKGEGAVEAHLARQGQGLLKVLLGLSGEGHDQVAGQPDVRDGLAQGAHLIGMTALPEAKLAREKSDFHIAEAKLENARKILESADREAGILLHNYFSAYPQWKEQVETAVNQSKNNRSILLVVDKMAHELRVYQGGKQIHTFAAEFGPNWIGDKQRKGDQATPEGIYQVTQKKERRKTIYHKALLLNYPNEKDQDRFKNNIKAGKIPPKTEIGGLIEIHGNGGRGFDWTNGCVALSNKDMDAVFRIAEEKTPVVIVGSMITLEAYLDKVKKE